MYVSMCVVLMNSLPDFQRRTRTDDVVDDDLLSCFLWAAGENAVAQPGWESPSVNPLKGETTFLLKPPSAAETTALPETAACCC